MDHHKYFSIYGDPKIHPEFVTTIGKSLISRTTCATLKLSSIGFISITCWFMKHSSMIRKTYVAFSSWILKFRLSFFSCSHSSMLAFGKCSLIYSRIGLVNSESLTFFDAPKINLLINWLCHTDHPKTNQMFL